MSVMDTLEAMYKDQTYSHRNGYKRKPQVVSPSFQYHENGNLLTDKEIELHLIQHKNMVKFLDEKGLLDAFNAFQKSKQVQTGEFVEWYKKWN